MFSSFRLELAEFGARFFTLSPVQFLDFTFTPVERFNLFPPILNEI